MAETKQEPRLHVVVFPWLPDGAESTNAVPPEKVELLKVAFDGLASPVAFFLMEACATGTGGEGRARCSLTTTSRWLRYRAVAGEGVRGGGGAPSTAASGRRAHSQWASRERVEGGSPRESGRRVEEHRKLRAGGDGEPRPLGKQSEQRGGG